MSNEACSNEGSPTSPGGDKWRAKLFILFRERLAQRRRPHGTMMSRETGNMSDGFHPDMYFVEALTTTTKFTSVSGERALIRPTPLLLLTRRTDVISAGKAHVAA